MNASLLVRSILLRLWRHRGRTLFMALGLSVAVLVSALLMSLMVAVKARFAVFIARAYPADGLVVMGGGGPMSGAAGRDSLKLTDVETLVASLDEAEWDPIVYAGERDVKHAGNDRAVNVMGVSEKAESVRRQSVRQGEYFSAEDVQGRAAVALIGVTTARNLFPDRSPLGATLFVDSIPFTVKGVLEPLGFDVHGRDQDDGILVPYTTLTERLLHVDHVNAVTFRFDDRDRVDGAREEILEIVRARHGIGPGERDDFVVISAAAMQKRVAQTFRKFDVFIPLIAGVAFLLSALVVMAIMQVSIRGRFAEIGLRKAVGARERDLQTQIVFEVLLVSLLASVAGLALARAGLTVALPALSAKFGVTEVSVSLPTMFTVTAAALVTGALGALLPARRAARLDPVAALR